MTPFFIQLHFRLISNQISPLQWACPIDQYDHAPFYHIIQFNFSTTRQSLGLENRKKNKLLANLSVLVNPLLMSPIA
jgi:hypothetical protein